MAAATGSSMAQFGNLLGGGRSSGGGNVDADVANFLGRSFVVEMTAAKASLAIGAAFAAESDRAKFQSLFDNVNKQTKPQEAGAAFQAARETADAEIKRLSEAKDLSERTKALSQEKQALLAKGVGNFLLAGLQSKDIVSAGQSMITSVGANPMNLSKIVPAKDAVTRLANAASLAGSAIPKLVEAMKGANVSVVSVSSSSKEEKIDSLP
jgi:hypothetical protein